MGIISNSKVHEKELYKLDGKNTVLMEGDYYERHFVILRHHSGKPNAYVEVLEDDWIAHQEPSEFAKEHKYDDRYEWFGAVVNGGATYYGGAYWNPEDHRTYIGWDYGHCDDYDPLYEAVSDKKDTGHKWNFAEILMDIAHAIDGFWHDNLDRLSEMETKAE